MIKKIFKHRFIEDVLRIARVCLDNGYFADLEDCAEIWADYSEDEWCASWLILPENDETIWNAIEVQVKGKSINN